MAPLGQPTALTQVKTMVLQSTPDRLHVFTALTFPQKKLTAEVIFTFKGLQTGITGFQIPTKRP